MRRRRDMSELPCLRRGFRHLPFAGRPLSATASTHLDPGQPPDVEPGRQCRLIGRHDRRSARGQQDRLDGSSLGRSQRPVSHSRIVGALPMSPSYRAALAADYVAWVGPWPRSARSDKPPPLRPPSDAHCTRQRGMPSSVQKEWRQSSEIIKRRAIGRRREDLNRHVIGAGVVVEPHLARDRGVLTPGDNRIEDPVATR